jgi:predicted amidohydrolase YtcJ
MLNLSADVIAKVESYAKSHKKQIAEGQWIEGAGWDQNIWPVKAFPKAVRPVHQAHHSMTAKSRCISQTDFDRSKALRNLPIALKRIDIHAEWVSPKVLEMMGDLPEEVPGGQIERDADGKPTGVFVSDHFFFSAWSLIPSATKSWTMPCS